ncbi:hypothetical protein R6Z07M_017108 [Ovis aries]
MTTRPQSLGGGEARAAESVTPEPREKALLSRPGSCVPLARRPPASLSSCATSPSGRSTRVSPRGPHAAQTQGSDLRAPPKSSRPHAWASVCSRTPAPLPRPKPWTVHPPCHGQFPPAPPPAPPRPGGPACSARGLPRGLAFQVRGGGSSPAALSETRTLCPKNAPEPQTGSDDQVAREPHAAEGPGLRRRAQPRRGGSPRAEHQPGGEARGERGGGKTRARGRGGCEPLKSEEQEKQPREEGAVPAVRAAARGGSLRRPPRALMAQRPRYHSRPRAWPPGPGLGRPADAGAAGLPGQGQTGWASGSLEGRALAWRRRRGGPRCPEAAPTRPASRRAPAVAGWQPASFPTPVLPRPGLS